VFWGNQTALLVPRMSFSWSWPAQCLAWRFIATFSSVWGSEPYLNARYAAHTNTHTHTRTRTHARTFPSIIQRNVRKYFLILRTVIFNETFLLLTSPVALVLLVNGFIRLWYTCKSIISFSDTPTAIGCLSTFFGELQPRISFSTV